MYCDDSGCDICLCDGVTKEDKDWLEEKLSAVIDEFHQKIGLQSNWFQIINMDSFFDEIGCIGGIRHEEI